MIRILATSAAVALSTLAVSVVATAWAAPSETTKLSGQINVTATRILSFPRSLPPHGRQSDRVEQTWRITDRHGKTIGKMFVTCRWIRPHARFCWNELQLPRGKIVTAGSSVSPFEGEYAVVGGTGGYDEAMGEMLFSAIGLRKTVVLINLTT